MDNRIDTPESHNPMTFEQMREWLRWNGPSIGRLARQGDKDATRVEFAYRAWWDHRLDVKLQDELFKIVKEYMVRDMTLTERAELERKYGHKLPEKLQ